MRNSGKHRLTRKKSSETGSSNLRQRIFSIALAVGLATSAGLAIANQITINSVEAGAGKIETPACLAPAKVDFTYSVASGGVSSVTGITVTGVSSDCSGQIISLKVLNSSNGTIDEVIWNPTITAGDTSITLRADGTTTSSSNASANGVTTVWPNSQTSPEGLQSFATTQVRQLQFSLLATSRAATN
jgi:hypothetical protein